MNEEMRNEEFKIDPNEEVIVQEDLESNPLYFNRKQAIVGGIVSVAIAAAGFAGGYFYKKAQYTKAERSASADSGTPMFEGAPEELF